MTLPTFHKILVAFDGSPNSVEACDLTTLLAKAYKSEVVITHVLPPIPSLTAPRRQVYEATIENKANILAMKMVSRLGKEGVEAKARTLHPKVSVSEALIDFAAAQNVDLIAAGTRGLGGFRRMVLGSVSTNLVNHALCPVLVVRKKLYRIETQLRKILVATDGSKSANDALEYAASIAKSMGADLTIVHVIYLPPYSYAGGGYAVGEIYKDLTEYGEKIAAEASKLAEKNGVHATTKVIDNQQSPVSAMVKFAEEQKFDLIVVGTRGLGGVKKLFLGSVANGVVHYAKCSVLVTR